MTKLQLKLYNFIKDYIAQHGFAPTFTEMRKHMGSSSNQVIYDKLAALEDKGYIKRGKSARAIVIIDRVQGEWYGGTYGNVTWRTTDKRLAQHLGALGTFYKVKI